MSLILFSKLRQGSLLALGAIAVLSGWTPVHAKTNWKLLREEKFNQPFSADSVAWVKDSLDSDSPWATGVLGDGGEFFRINGGAKFQTQLQSFDLLRKQVKYGKDGWLTVELAARGHGGKPRNPPSFSIRKLDKLGTLASLAEPSHD